MTTPGGRTHVPLVLAALALAFAVLAVNSEIVRAVAPGCLFRNLTGLDCAGCGGTRALFAAIRGDIAGSLRLHPLFLPGICLGLLVIAAEGSALAGKDSRWLRPFRLTQRKGIAVAAGVLLFGLLRNLPWWPFTLISAP